jgi:ABC-type thiamine transport system ATPase subunit
LTEAIIEADGVVKRFGKVEALAGLELVACSGQVTAVLGPNGAGKTTFERTVATLVRPDAGTLRVAADHVLNTYPALAAALADGQALFVSGLQPSQEPGPEQIRHAVAAAARRFGSRGCAGRVAQEFGEHPEAAAARMRWARQAVAGAFGRPGLHRSGTGPSWRHPVRHAA